MNKKVTLVTLLLILFIVGIFVFKPKIEQRIRRDMILDYIRCDNTIHANDGKVFFRNIKNDIYAMDIATNEDTLISKDYRESKITDVTNDYMLLINKDSNLQLANITGELINTFRDISVIDALLYNECIYYIGSNDKSIYKVELDGTQTQKISNVRADSFKIDNDIIYYTDANCIYKTQMGSDISEIVTDKKYSVFYDVKDGLVYHSAHNNFSKIYVYDTKTNEDNLFVDIPSIYFSANNDYLFCRRSYNEVELAEIEMGKYPLDTEIKRIKIK